MNYQLFKNLFLMNIIIMSFLFSACSKKNELVYNSSTSRIWLGVQAKNIPEKRLNNLKLDFGLQVIKVYKNSPAEKAGLQKEDILLKINGKPLEKLDNLIDLVRTMKSDEKIIITYLREGEKLETEATIDKNDREIYSRRGKYKSPEHFVSDNKHPWLGVSTDKLTDQLRTFFNIPEDLGVLVTEVVEDSPAEKYGLKAGDVILQIGDKEVEDTYTLIRALDCYNVGDEVDVKLIRNREEKTLEVTLGEEKERYRHQFSYGAEVYEVEIPEIDIEISPIDIDIPEIDMKELEELHQKIRENLELHEDELKEKLENLNEKLKEIKIRTTNRKSIVI